MAASIERLATDCAKSSEWVRDALDGMVYRGWLVVLRQDLSADRGAIRQFPEHARITLVLDWALLDHSHDEKIDDETDNEEIDLSTIRWSSSPWAVYRSISQDPQISKDALKVLSNLPFRAKNSDGGASLPSFDQKREPTHPHSHLPRHLARRRHRHNLPDRAQDLQTPSSVTTSESDSAERTHPALPPVDSLCSAPGSVPGRIPRRPSTVGDRSLLGRLVIEGSFKLAEPGRRWS